MTNRTLRLTESVTEVLNESIRSKLVSRVFLFFDNNIKERSPGCIRSELNERKLE